MAEKPEAGTERKGGGLRPKPKGSIVLKGLIVLATAFMLYSIITPIQKWEETERMVILDHAKMKTIRDISFRYLFVDTTYTSDLDKLVNFAKTISDSLVPDSLFADLLNAYQRIPEFKEQFKGVDLKTFRTQHLDKLPVCEAAVSMGLTESRFRIEVVTASGGGKRFNVLSPKVKDEFVSGSIFEGKPDWDERYDNVALGE